MVANWDEKIDDISPGSAGFSRDGGRATLPIFFDGNNETYIKTILGFVTPAGDGSLNRTLPIAHPVYWWMLASNIQNISGYGKPTKRASSPLITPEAQVPTYYADYQKYLYTVEFTHRPYPVCSNSKIQVADGGWAMVDGTATTDIFTTEYIRYTDYDIQPGVKVITARSGQMVFRANSTPPGNGRRMFTGVPAVYLPVGVIKFRWYEVPTSYIESADSFILKYLGYINQKDFKIGNRWWTPGQLRYAGVGVRRYLGPVPDTVINTVGKPTNLNARLMDIEFVWEYSLAENSSPPTPSPTAFNANRIPYGHNIFPNYEDRKFYYVTTLPNPDAEAGQYPTYSSVPFQLLFTDPDA